MSDRQVPWALGRRVLIRPHGQWLEAVEVADGYVAPNGDRWRAGWVVVSRAGTSTATTWYPPDAGPTAPLPDECPRCGWLGCHEDGCMVAANLARGVSAFWAPWVMEIPPTVPNARLCYGLLRNGQAIELQWYSRNGVPPTVWKGWETPNRLDTEEIDDLVGYFALNGDGPTLSPWENP